MYLTEKIETAELGLTSYIIAMLITSTFLHCPTQQYVIPHYLKQ